MKKGGQGINEKSNLLQRKYYQCYCAKNYQSYSALYLHVKNKHNQNLSFKSFNQQRVEWSGSVKNIILEFDEEYDNIKKPDTTRLNLRRRSKKISLKESDQDEKNEREVIKTQNKVKIEEQLDANSPKIITVKTVFDQYQKTCRDRSQKTFRLELLDKLMKYINQNYQYYFPELGYVSCFSQQFSPNEVSYMFNDFFLKEYSYLRDQADSAVIQLIKLSKWLSQNNYTNRVVVKIQPVQQSHCKVEQTAQKQEKVKVQNIDNL